MESEKRVDGNLALKGKGRKPIVIEATCPTRQALLRVAAYARVSSSSDDQLNSLAAQTRYYTDLISGKEGWEMVDIYADEGITGTSVKKRDDFKRLMADCRRGLIDRVLVKSISRFARNTMDCLEAIRELKSLGVGVYFEEQRIDTATMSGEMVTALFAAIAQEESKSISMKARWSTRNRMAAGTYLPSKMPYGYRLVDKETVIEPREALIVCQIYQDYLSGMGTDAIARKLEKQGVPKGQNGRWGHSTISYILRNERYIGNSLWQKTYATDSLPVKQVQNKGHLPKYYAEGTHPPILSNEIYSAVQRLIADKIAHLSDEKSAAVPLFSRHIVCGQCGASIRKRIVRGHIYWLCRTHEANLEKCGVTEIPNSALCDAFLRLYYNLKHQGSDILPQMLTDLQTIQQRKMLWSPDIVDLNKRIADLSSENQMWTEYKRQGVIDPDVFITRTNEIAQQLRATKLEKERLVAERADDTISKTQELIEALEDGPDSMDAFDGELFRSLVDKIIVESNDAIRFRLHNGLELRETIERTVRG